MHYNLILKITQIIKAKKKLLKLKTKFKNLVKEIKRRR